MEATKVLISGEQRARLDGLAKRADELHSKISMDMLFRNPMMADIAAITWNTRAMLRAEHDDSTKPYDGEHAARLDMWVSLRGGNASDINHKITVMDAVLTFWEKQTAPDIKNGVKRLK